MKMKTMMKMTVKILGKIAEYTLLYMILRIPFFIFKQYGYLTLAFSCFVTSIAYFLMRDVVLHIIYKHNKHNDKKDKKKDIPWDNYLD